jgi:autophagy-related protein 9
MLSRVFGKGSIYETLDLDDRRDDEHPDYDLYNSGLTHDDPHYSGIDPRNESFVLQSRGAHPSSRSARHHLATNSLYRHYENTLPNLNEEDANEEDANDDVPGSLLVEENHHEDQDHRQGFYEPVDPSREQVIDNMERGLSPPPRGGSRTPDPTVWLGLVDPKERAMWKWANVENLDVFLQQAITPHKILLLTLPSRSMATTSVKGSIASFSPAS